MNTRLRIGCYLAVGATGLWLIDPPRGWVAILLIIGYVCGAAYVDAWWRRPASARPRPPRSHGNVISIDAYRNYRFHRGGPFRLRSRRNSRSVFQSPMRIRAEELFQALLAEGLHPRIVQRLTAEHGEQTLFEVRLPEDQIEAAEPTLQRFRYKQANSPS